MKWVTTSWTDGIMNNRWLIYKSCIILCYSGFYINLRRVKGVNLAPIYGHLVLVSIPELPYRALPGTR